MDIKRKRIIELHLAGKRQADIVRELRHLNVQKMFVHRTVKRYETTGSIAVRNGRRVEFKSSIKSDVNGDDDDEETPSEEKVRKVRKCI